ncbi:MAG: hypothetical protein AB1736_07215 [Chloroflexota bacterium]
MPARQLRGRQPLVSLPLLAATLVVALVAMACGGSAGPGVATLESADPAASGDATPAPSVDPEEAALAFAECMRDHGIDMPDPQIDSNGNMRVTIGAGGNIGEIDRETMEAAQEACRELLPGAGLARPGGRELTPEDEERILAFAECMREHGIDVPDPQFGGGGGFIRVGPGAGGDDDGQAGDGPAFDPNDEDFQAAQEACRELLPGFGPDPRTDDVR